MLKGSGLPFIGWKLLCSFINRVLEMIQVGFLEVILFVIQRHHPFVVGNLCGPKTCHQHCKWYCLLHDLPSEWKRGVTQEK